MEFLADQTKLNKELAEQVGPEYLDVLARIHRIHPTGVLTDAPLDGSAAQQADLDWWTELNNDSADASAYLDLVLRALRLSKPEPDPQAVFLHGDAGAGNFLVADGHLAGLIDWEMAHTGDFHEDVAWVCMRMVFTPFGSPQQRLIGYEKASGRTVVAPRLSWYKAYVTWKSLVAVDRTLRQGGGRETFVVQTSRIVAAAYQPLLSELLLSVLADADVSSPKADEVIAELSDLSAAFEKAAQSNSTVIRVLERARAGGYLS
ncbi:phosphotransferase [Williamsia sp. DF01-3]|nr:phosphotransferase [Williamsia sp. DF01-3]